MQNQFLNLFQNKLNQVFDVKNLNNKVFQYLNIYTLWNLAITQPLYTIMHEEGFIFSTGSLFAIFLYIFMMSFGFPTLLVFGISIAGHIHAKAKQYLYNSIIFILITLLALPFLKLIPYISGWFIVILAILAGIVFSLALKHIYGISLFVRFLSISIVLLPVLLLAQNSHVLYSMTQKNSPGQPVYIKSDIPVVLIVFDELPITSLLDTPSSIDSKLFPNFSTLLQNSFWFRNTTSVHSSTLGAVPSILTGRKPLTSKAGNLSTPEKCINHPPLYFYPEFSQNLFTFFRHSYNIHHIEQMTQLYPQTNNQAEKTNMSFKDSVLQIAHRYIGPTLQKYSYQILPDDVYTKLLYPVRDIISQDISADKHVDHRFESILQNITSKHMNSFYYIHLLFPHGPWQFYPSGKRYNDFKYLPRLYATCFSDSTESFCHSQWRYHTFYQKHLLQVAFTDRLLGQLVEKLKSEKLYDRALIIVTSDHGISIQKNDMLRKVSKTNAADVLSVPLFIKIPYQKNGVINDLPVQTTDIAPTIADVLGSSIPWKVDGSSVFQKKIPNKTEIAICSPREKLVFSPEILQEKYKTLDRKLALFGSRNTTPKDLFAFGPYKNLVGQSLSEFKIDNKAKIKINMSYLQNLKNVNLNKETIPLQMEGSVNIMSKDIKPDSVYLAIVMDGKIQTVTPIFQPFRRNEYRFAALIPESAFHSGENKADVFQIISEKTLKKVEN